LLNTWYHAAVTYDGVTLQICPERRARGPGARRRPAPRADSIQHAALGSALPVDRGRGGFFAGTLDEARIWNYARTPAQIAASISREIPMGSGLLGRWSFNECCGRLIDSTGHVANGTLFGTGWSWVTTPPLTVVANTAPIVAAGPSQTVTLPAKGSLLGSVIDDGAITGLPLSIAWSKKSGPGSVSFDFPASPATPASFSDLGTYVLTLTANDGDFLVSSDVTITVDGVVNQPPAPNAGLDVTTVLPIDSVSLSGSATDDGQPGGPLSFQWSKVSGPGAVTFGNASAASTSATFAAEGSYVLKLHVSDGLLAADDTVSVTVSPSSSNSAIQFGGTNAAITFGPAPHLGAAAFTLEAWIRRDGAGVATFTGTGGITAVPLVTKGMAETEGGTQDMNYFLGISAATGALAADFEDTATGGNHPITGGTPIATDGHWHHVAATFNGTTWQLFLDGQPDGSLAVGAFTPRFDSMQHAALGTALNSAVVVTSGQTPGFFNGVLDEVRIWNYARSQAQIAGGLNREIPAASGLLGRWGLNEGTGTVVADSSGGNVGGTIVGSNWSWVSGAHITGQPNAAPGVNAGIDASVTLPGTGMLIGSATDDGIGGGGVAVQWSQVSGPGTASFGNAASAVSTVDFNAVGTFVLRLTASDGELSASDDVQIIVDGVINQPPTVNAGIDQTITLPANVANLVGLVGDDGGVVTMLWSAVSGPASVVFATPATSSTTATFAMDGTYVLRLSASDGILSASDTVTVTVAPDAANKALKFLGTNAFVTFGSAPSLGLQKFTIETWFRRDGAGVATFTGTGGVTAIPLITKGMAEVDQIDDRDMNYFLGIRQTDGVLVADFEDTATAANHPIAGATVIPAGAAWHHAAATYDGDKLRLYLDGVLERELAVGLTPRFDSIQHAVLGGALNSTGGVGTQPQGFFNGALDEARVWNYARSVGQIQRGRLLEIAQPTPGLVARWGMNETSGTQAGSSAGAGPTGDIIGSGWSRVSGAPFVYVNHAPAAGDDSATTDEDASIVIPVLSNDADLDADALSILAAGGAGHGSATVNPDGTVTYLPAANYHGSDSFTYTVSDGQGASATGTVSVTVTAVNDAPVAAADAASTNEDAAVTISVLSNDSDGDGDAITPAIVSGPLNGAAVVNADGTIEYTPAPNFFGGDSFTYKVNDGTTDSGTVTVVVTVHGVNDAPVAAADSYAVDEDASLQIAAPGLLDNDRDADDDPLGVALVSGPSHGGLTLNADGSFVYTPDTNFNGADSFIYQVNDGVADSAPVTVSLTVRPVNDAPAATDDSYTTGEDTPLVVAAAGVLSNDSDLDGDALHAVLVSGPANGVLALNADGGFTYTPNANFNGVDSFSYKSSDGGEESGVGVVAIIVSAVNDAPVATADSYSVNEDATLAIGGPGVLSNDTDVEGSALSAVLVSGPSHGTLTLNGDGSFSYVPAADYHGADSFSYKADDGADSSAVATVSITVDAVNDAPVAGDDTYTTVEDTALTISAPGVLGNDTDVDGMQTLQAAVVAGPAHGTWH
jgi:VCBS repeat-containing protein